MGCAIRTGQRCPRKHVSVYHSLGALAAPAGDIDLSLPFARFAGLLLTF